MPFEPLVARVAGRYFSARAFDDVTSPKGVVEGLKALKGALLGFQKGALRELYRGYKAAVATAKAKMIRDGHFEGKDADKVERILLDAIDKEAVPACKTFSLKSLKEADAGMAKAFSAAQNYYYTNTQDFEDPIEIAYAEGPTLLWYKMSRDIKSAMDDAMLGLFHAPHAMERFIPLGKTKADYPQMKEITSLSDVENKSYFDLYDDAIKSAEEFVKELGDVVGKGVPLDSNLIHLDIAARQAKDFWMADLATSMRQQIRKNRPPTPKQIEALKKGFETYNIRHTNFEYLIDPRWKKSHSPWFEKILPGVDFDSNPFALHRDEPGDGITQERATKLGLAVLNKFVASIKDLNLNADPLFGIMFECIHHVTAHVPSEVAAEYATSQPVLYEALVELCSDYNKLRRAAGGKGYGDTATDDAFTYYITKLM